MNLVNSAIFLSSALSTTVHAHGLTSFLKGTSEKQQEDKAPARKLTLFDPNTYAGPADFVAEIDSDNTVPCCCLEEGGHECGETCSSDDNGRGNTGTTKFWINENEGDVTIAYEIYLPGLDIDEWVTKGDSSDDVTKIHFHNNVPGVKGPHALNVLKAPCQDDFDLVLQPFGYKILGIWDSSDLGCPGVTGGGASQKLEDMLVELCSSKIYVNVHTNFCLDGELRGQAIPASAKAAAFCANLGL
eukprot:CAMPEP_0183775982 /NCGR_PEP_ID=MMETSP0739-20130205/45748_1 /TAXON_ID=385413 /ORGANISM="Thalassiosira miniscula, Strain CCMP1093" /LENGTH=243 /DNA_ID=CAMNT_0026017731 /DNA_START=37 /DNA_END=768 /DNA_ORIENTATION=-